MFNAKQRKNFKQAGRDYVGDQMTATGVLPHLVQEGLGCEALDIARWALEVPHNDMDERPGMWYRVWAAADWVYEGMQEALKEHEGVQNGEA